MKPYRICPNCGAHLDPGETCDCKKETESRIIYLLRMNPEQAEPFQQIMRKGSYTTRRPKQDV